MIAFKIAKAGISKKTTINLFYDSQAIEPGDTVQSLKMEENDVITVFGHPNVFVPFNITKENNPMLELNSSGQTEEVRRNYKVDENIVNSLAMLGFDKQQSRQALALVLGDTGKAIEILKKTLK